MDYKKVLEELYSLDVEKWTLGLERIESLLKKLGNPEKKLKCIHVAGTNGKGSVCAMISSILVDAGYKVGMYTSPHLKKFNERIRINDKLISDEDIINYYLKVKKCVKNQSFFEITTAMAFLYFAEKNVDFAVLEVGLGGRLDATNVVIPLVSIITNIGLEHAKFLGNTIEKIAYEKAGIIKKNIPTVTASDGIALATIKKISNKRNSRLCIVNKKNANYSVGLKGEFQKLNSAMAIKAIGILKNNYGVKIKKSNVKKGLLNAKWPGRLEFIAKNILVDCAHNPHGFKVLVKELMRIDYKRLIIVLGFSNDKDIKKISEIISPLANKIILTKSQNERAAEPETIRKYFKQRNSTNPRIGGMSSAQRPPINWWNSEHQKQPESEADEIMPPISDGWFLTDSIVIKNPKEALNHAKKIAKKEDLILVAGSIFLVGETL